jgi:hypothetical protein
VANPVMTPWSIQLREVNDGVKVSGMMVAATSTPVWAARPEKKPALGWGPVVAISVSLCPRRNDVLIRSALLKALTPARSIPCAARCGLRELGAAAPAEGGNGFAFGWLMRDEQARAERVEAQLDSAWATLRRRARALTR